MLPRSFRNPAGCAAFLFPLVAVIDNKLIPVLMIAMLIGVAYVSRPWKLRLWLPLAAGFGALLAWCLLSALWSIDPADSLWRFGRLFPTIIGGLVLCALVEPFDAADRTDAGRYLAIGSLVAGLIGIGRQLLLKLEPTDAVADILRELRVYPYASIAAVLLFVLLATLETRPFPRLTLAALAAGIVAVLFCGSETTVIAFAAGSVVFVATRCLGRKAVQALAVILPLLFVAVPSSLGALDLPSHIKAHGWIVGGSVGHRLIIWRYASDKIHAKPLLGWGLFSARRLPDRENRADNDPHYADIFAVTWFSPGAKIELMPLHPHNATLHIWLELGFLGVLLYAPLYALCLFGLLRMSLSPVALAAGAAAVVAVFVIGQLSYSVWQSWWLCAQFLLAGIYLYVSRRVGRSPQSG